MTIKRLKIPEVETGITPEELRQRLHDKPNRNWETHEQVMAAAREKFIYRKSSNSQPSITKTVQV